MSLLQDYIYRFPIDRMSIAGRCRVRIYKPKSGGATVVLTELNQNPGESIAGACDRIATGLVERWQLAPQTTRWLLQDTTTDLASLRLCKVTFTWDGKRKATAPQWADASDDQVHEWTGVTLNTLERRLGDPGSELKGA